ncbi:hypothetical protein [Jiulongibacter sp. NS-SX5]|uniref:hypothetical protein n=1 Tax=Jiulongibacter sp. NS-SX5 TaxID=3463854 RepID=UPI0040599CFE
MSQRLAKGLFFLSTLAYTFFLKSREDFWLLFLLVAFQFLAYILVIKSKGEESFLESILWILVISLPFFFSSPILSDDVYRFIWDGRLTNSGINPYSCLPSAVEDASHSSLFQALNSPDYFSVYPPVKQYIFSLTALLSSGNEDVNITLLRILVLVSVFWLAISIRKILEDATIGEDGSKNALTSLIVLNPLLLIESIGNLHFEVLMVAFLFSSFLYRRSLIFFAFLFSVAVSVKLIPLILLPLIMKHLGLRKGLFFSLFVLIANVLYFLPFLDQDVISNFSNSLDLYFHRFEFNASIYYFLRYVGYQFTGYNTIYFLGTALAIIDIAVILYISVKSKSFLNSVVWILALHLLLSTTVHPWYLIPLLCVSILANFRFGMVWSGLIFLSYSAYQYEPVQENWWLIALSYFSVFVFLVYDLKRSELRPF